MEAASSDDEQAPSPVCRSRRAHEAAMVGPHLFVFGGYCLLEDYEHDDFEFQRNAVYAFDTVRKAWHLHRAETESGPPPAACTGASTIAVGRVIYSFGGLEVVLSSYSRQFSNSVFALNVDTMTWRRCEDRGGRRIAGRDKCAVCLIDAGRVLMFGGWSARIDADVLEAGAQWVPDSNDIVGWNNESYVFDIESETWSSLDASGPRPSPRAAHSLVKIDASRIVLFGGREREQRLNDIHILNLDAMCWSGKIVQPADPTILWPSPRSLHTMNSVSYGPHVGCVLLGGMGVDGNCCDDFAWHLNLNEMEWTKIPWCSDEFKRTWHKTCTFSSGPGYFEFYVFGGSPDNIWQPRSKDLGGPTFTSFGVKSLYLSAMEAACQYEDRLRSDLKFLPLKIKQEFGIRLSGFKMQDHRTN